MVNSASQAIAEFKSQRLGGLLSGTSSTISAATNLGPSLSDTASERMARMAPKKSTTAALDQIRQRGQSYHSTALQGFQAQQQAARQRVMAGNGYQLPSGAAGGGPQASGPLGTRYDGIRQDAANALSGLENLYRKQFGTNFVINDGYRSYQDQVNAWNTYQRGGPKAAQPGTSLHGGGTAVDLGGAILNAGSAQHAWLRQNAARLKWYWVGQRYGEPWHWEYHPEW